MSIGGEKKDDDVKAPSLDVKMSDPSNLNMLQTNFSNPGQMDSLAKAIQNIARQSQEMQIGPDYSSIPPELLEMIKRMQMGV